MAGLLISCNEIELETPTFEVVAPQLTVNAGDSLRFDFRGDAHVITFYSGVPGSVYAYRNRTQKELEGEVTLSFSTRVLNSYEMDPRELDLVVSTDFNGNYTYENVTAANWQVISDRFTFPAAETGNLTAAGKKTISDLFVPGQPFYMAFRYQTIGMPPATRMGRNWRVELFSLLNEFEGGSTVLANQVSAGWSMVHENNVDPGRGGTVQTVRLNFLANNMNREIPLDIWAVSQPVDLFKVEPDKGVAIKNLSQNRMESYTYVYDTPGTYTAVFVASNSTVYGHQTVEQQVHVTVNP